MRRYAVALILLPALFLAACSGGGPSADSEQQAGATHEPEPTPVFDDGFDTGDTEEWSEDKPADAPADEGAGGSD